MKKGIFAFALFLISINLGISQNRNEDLKKEMDTFQLEMEEAMKQFSQLFDKGGDFLLKVDTMNLDLHSFGIDPNTLEEQFRNFDMENPNMDDMMQILQLQIQMMEELDWSQFNQLFKEFGLSSPNFPSPNQQKGNTPGSTEDTPAKAPKKKRKTYKL